VATSVPSIPLARPAAAAAPAPRAAVQPSGGGVLITSAADLDNYLRGEAASASGAVVTAETAMRVAAVYACVRIIAGAVATLPLQIKRRIDDRTRENASDTVLWTLINRKPCRWLKPAQFRRMLQAHVLLRGNAYCLKVKSRGEIRELIPLNPDRVKTEQRDDLSIVHKYTRPNGGTEEFRQDDIFHLFGLTLDGVRGVTPITYARETIGLSLAMERHGATSFKNGLRTSGILEHPNTLGEEARGNLRASLDEYRAGGEREGKFLILEEGMKVSEMRMTAADAQWIESRKFSRSDVAMFFGVPPHMIGDTEKSTSWGSGIEQQKDGFVTFTLDDHLTMWEEGITVDLALTPDIYAKFNRNALVKGDIRARWEAYTKALQWGVYSPNRVLELEDENPREGGDIYYPPPNTAGGDQAKSDSKDKGDDDPQDA
jgi:HK97 family phage portal protein